MKDRIPAPGKANRVRITRDDGQAVEGTLSYVDDAIQAGSRYTKQNVLPDDVCDALNIDRGGAEPKDAFNACWAVGDVKTTTRASLGANWHACDGSNFVAADLPELGAIIEPSIERGFKRVYPFGSDSAYIPTAIKYVNGYYVVLGSKYGSGEGAIAYTNSMVRGWSFVPLPTLSGGTIYWYDIIWDGARYVALALFIGTHSSGNFGAHMACAPQLGGAWSINSLLISCDNYPEPRLLFNDGIYCFTTRRSWDLASTMYYSSSPDSGWKSSVVSSKNSPAYCVAYAFGYYVAGGYEENGWDRGFYAYSSDAENWTSVSIEHPINCMVVANGVLVAGDSDGNIWYTTNPAGNWIKKKIWDTHSIERLTYDGELIATSYPGHPCVMARAASPDGEWRVEQWVPSTEFGADSNHPAALIGAHNGVIANGYSGGTQNVQQVYAYTDEFRSYPLITPAEPAKAFIRIK